MNRNSSLAVLSALAGMATLAPSAAAYDSNTVQVGVNPNFSGGSGPFSQNVTQPGTIDVSGSATGGFSSSGDGSCHVEYGVVRTTGHSNGSLSVVCRGIFRDSVTITAPGVPTGTPGALTFSLRVSGTFIATSGSSGASWQLQSDLGGGAYDINKGGGTRSPELSPPGPYGDAPGLFSATISFQYGFAMPLDAELTCTAGSAYSFTGPGHAEFGFPVVLTWEGIQNVRANGSPVPSFTLTSESGTHWEHALPAPTCGSPDFNCDGDVGTDADIEAFFACLAGGCPPPPCTSTADFNGDGDIGTDADIEAFFRVLAGGSC